MRTTGLGQDPARIEELGMQLYVRCCKDAFGARPAKLKVRADHRSHEDMSN
jgi:hypothetical protein